MSVRKRTWATSKGEQKEAWIVDYTDQNGERHIETFARKRTPTKDTRRSTSTSAKASTLRTTRALTLRKLRKTGSNLLNSINASDQRLISIASTSASILIRALAARNLPG